VTTENESSIIASSDEKGFLDILHVKRMWSRTQKKPSSQSSDPQAAADWIKDNTLVCGLRLGLRETFQYLYSNRPSFDQFEHWILEQNGGVIDPSLKNRLNLALSGGLNMGSSPDPSDRVFTAEEIAFWEENGYVVLHNAVSQENCAAAVDAICGFLEMDLKNPETWYRGPQGHSIWIPLLHHPALEANRNAARIHHAFAQLWGRTDLWATTDQTGMNPPEREGWRFPGPNLHWDVSLELPIPFGVQGILYLTDTAANQGAFTCVPGFHRRIESWLKSLPLGSDPRHENLGTPGPVSIAGKAGDLIIWHHALPHGSSPNRAARPRIVQYITLRPSHWDYNPTWR
jgi:ectoine hydroxylase-related dioxygenase (phytanoyl-CoA dioxygenase family)